MARSDLYGLVRGLRVVRHYQPDPLPEESLQRILQAGRWTGSSKNNQAWAFVLVRERARIQALMECGYFTTPFAGATAVVVLVRSPKGNDFDIGRAAQNMMLAAASEGIGSCPVSLHTADRAARQLGLPADHQARWAIALGYPAMPAEDEHRRQLRRVLTGGRRPLSELVHYEVWESSRESLPRGQ